MSDKANELIVRVLDGEDPRAEDLVEAVVSGKDPSGVIEALDFQILGTQKDNVLVSINGRTYIYTNRDPSLTFAQFYSKLLKMTDASPGKALQWLKDHGQSVYGSVYMGAAKAAKWNPKTPKGSRLAHGQYIEGAEVKESVKALSKSELQKAGKLVQVYRESAMKAEALIEAVVNGEKPSEVIEKISNLYDPRWEQNSPTSPVTKVPGGLAVQTPFFVLKGESCDDDDLEESEKSALDKNLAAIKKKAEQLGGIYDYENGKLFLDFTSVPRGTKSTVPAKKFATEFVAWIKKEYPDIPVKHHSQRLVDLG